MKLKATKVRYRQRMKKRFTKYCFKILSLILLISFLYTNSSLCELLVNNCNSGNSSCCCKAGDNNVNPEESIQKSCCCEIKEMTNQPAEINLYTADNGLKNLTLNPSISNTFIINDNSSDFIRCIKILSLHSPPKENIHILNSNFRI